MSIKMENRRFGYICVSSWDQNKGCQLQSMQEFDISPRDIFIDKNMGKIPTGNSTNY